MAQKYTMKISRLTVDKLGIKMYDKVAAALAELIANCYDADARRVTVEAPMGEFLASYRRDADSGENVIDDRGYRIVVKDDGHGMTPEEVNDFYLKVGAERRNDLSRPTDRRDQSPKFGRRVMGRKGVGKLAPFGICQKIEVLTSGGEIVDYFDENGQSARGYRTAHLILDREEIISDDDHDYHPVTGENDETFSLTTGTSITLSKFSVRKVPEMDLLEREISQRFGISSGDWEIQLKNTLNEDSETRRVGAFSVNRMSNTVINFEYTEDEDGNPVSQPVLVNGEDVDLQSGFEYEGKFFPIRGWVAYSERAFSDDLMAGIRIYCRGKIAAQTALFNMNAGFTGEHDIRSYAMGELHADWLDENEDLILTDRRDILWSDPLCQMLQEWGHKVIRRLGKLSREPMKRKALDIFKEQTKWDEFLHAAYPGDGMAGIRERAGFLAKMWAGQMRTDQLNSKEDVDAVAQLILLFAPHIELDEKLKKAANEDDCTLGAMASILKAANVAEMSSFGRIARNRLEVIERLESIEGDPQSVESDLQNLISGAPWLINPQWAPITANQSFTSFVENFGRFYEQHTGKTVSIKTMPMPSKRADFVMANFDGKIQVIEIKGANHTFNDEDFIRLHAYAVNMRDFFGEESHKDIVKYFNSFHIILVCRENPKLSDINNTAFRKLVDDGELTHKSWESFLQNTKMCHQEYFQEVQRNGRAT